MKLIRAKIKNFRSIEEMTIDFSEGCIVLVGINESGKSNILKALHLLDPKTAVGKDDLRIERSNENPVMDGLVEFHFDLNSDEVKIIYDQVKILFYEACWDDPIIRRGDQEITLHEYCVRMARTSLDVQIQDGVRQVLTWSTPDGFRVVPGWFKNGRSQNQIELLSSLAIVPPNLIAFSPKNSENTGLEHLSIESLEAIVSTAVRKLAEEKLPQCIFWRYGDDYLLPSQVDVNEFAANPDTCIPLKSMFELAGIRGQSAIASTIAVARSQPPHRYYQLLRRVGEAATEHIRRVWRDHKNLKIELRPNGDTIAPLITDHELPLDMASRSDGFKRFVSFLLLISAKVRTDELKGILLLVDEPEIALHPSGAKSLCKELVEIGLVNTVVYSTHSIFMIDKENIGRHLIIEKKNDVTISNVADKSKMQDEEVLYAAIGYSIFEALKLKNVIFEGWRDKEIFRIVRNNLEKNDAHFEKNISTWGSVHAEGVKDIKHIARMLELASRKCLIISDADKPALEKKRDYENDHGWGKWTTLNEILGEGFETGEDLFSIDSLVRRGNAFADSCGGIRHLATNEFTEKKPHWPVLYKWIADSDLRGDRLDVRLNQLKTALHKKVVRDELRIEADLLAKFVSDYEFE